MSDIAPVNLPKKRGRKPKNVVVVVVDTSESFDSNAADILPESSVDVDKNIPKKRGRKPKGGKIVIPVVPTGDVDVTKVNVILHLKCSLKDLQQHAFPSNNMEPYNSHIGVGFESTIAPAPMASHDFNDNYIINDTHQMEYYAKEPTTYTKNQSDEDVTMKEINKKLKQLEHQLHHNHTNEQNSACFWCTYSFDNQSIYIPKHLLKETYHVYGCFCSPECATAYLMQENIDSSIKFERYYLLNNIYGGVYNYTKNIKPAPSPYYMLEKYYGNLTIQEYRALLSNDRLFLIVDKPLTKVMPELHQANEDHIISHKIIPMNQGPKKSVKKNVTKNDILVENFGFNLHVAAAAQSN